MKTTIFLNNKTQAVRIPSALRFPKGTKKLFIRKVGSDLVLSPIENPWHDYFNRPPLSKDEQLIRVDDLSLDDRIILK